MPFGKLYLYYITTNLVFKSQKHLKKKKKISKSVHQTFVFQALLPFVWHSTRMVCARKTVLTLTHTHSQRNSKHAERTEAETATKSCETMPSPRKRLCAQFFVFFHLFFSLCARVRFFLAVSRPFTSYDDIFAVFLSHFFASIWRLGGRPLGRPPAHTHTHVRVRSHHRLCLSLQRANVLTANTIRFFSLVSFV